MAVRGICSIPECGKPHYGVTFCQAHYARFRKYGDPLGAAKKHPAKSITFLKSLLGTDKHDCIIWPFSRYSNGYGHIGFRVGGVHQNVIAHRVMCELAHGQPPTPKHQAAHSCGKGSAGCVNPSHLRWKTATENAWDKDAHGTMTRGEKIPWAKATDDVVRMIRSSSMKASELARMLGMSQSNIYVIRARKTWRHI